MQASSQVESTRADAAAGDRHVGTSDRAALDDGESLSPERMGLRRRLAFDLPPALPLVLLLAAVASLAISAFLN